jgi:hypothetical protein
VDEVTCSEATNEEDEVGQKTLSEFKIEIRAREGGKHKSKVDS